MLTVWRLKQLLRYDPESGHFIRLLGVSNVPVNSRAGSVGGGGYRYIAIDGTQYRENRLAWFYMTEAWPAGQVDHINGDPVDNRWSNLRLASHKLNTANAARRKDNKSGAKGIRLAPSGKWQVRIGCGGRVHVGTYETFEEAKSAYANAAAAEYGEFARPA